LSLLSKKNHHLLPRALPGYEHINRYWDKERDKPAAKILPGELYVTKSGELVSTVLGSCISACIRDRKSGIGGMNHFMLPAKGEVHGDGMDVGAAARYGNWAMEYLINGIMKAGGERRNLEVKIFGGGQVLANMTAQIGARNIQFVREYLASEQLPIVAEDVGDIYPRKVIYDPSSGVTKMKKLRSTHNSTIEKREKAYIDSISQPVVEDTGGDIELF